MKSRTFVFGMMIAVLSGLAGWFASSNLSGRSESDGGSATADGPCPGGAQALYWKAPMDPTYVRDEPGKSPMGMDLVPECPGNGGGGASGEGVRVDSNLMQSMGVRSVLAVRRDVAHRVRAVGRVTFDERLISHVHTKIQGWIEKLQVEYEGQAVREGQPMIEIYSPDLVATQEELLLAARYRDAVSESEFADVRDAGTDLFDATRRRLELWDIPSRDIERLLDTGEIRKTVTLYAPTGGFVSHMMARQGMEVGQSDNLFTIADLSKVWIYADIYEYEVPWVSEGQTAKVELRSMPGTSFDAKVTYVYPVLDPTTRTVRVRLELPNPDLLLKPEMFADVTIDSETQNDVVTIPEEAVIRSGRRNLVIVSVEEGRFQPREVELGLDSGDGWIEVRSGIDEGERIVTSGQFLIDSESRLQEAVQKLLAHQEEAAEAMSERPPDPPAGGDSMDGMNGVGSADHDAMNHAPGGVRAASSMHQE